MPGSRGAVKILIVDDHAVLRAGLRQVLQVGLGAELREADGAEMALAVAEAFRPRLAVLDIGLPGRSGLTVIAELRALGVQVVVLSAYTEPLYAQRALQAGALGYVTKNAAPQQLLDALRAASEGRRFIEPSVAQDLALRQVSAGGALDRLTSREMEILRLLAEGSSLTEIASALSVSYKTVANTASLMRAKLGITRMADLIRLAIGMS
ncbi:response regulator transcription factor [Lichenicoccus roseus]|uniref:Response regulator transcription factor n=1 Tax=Lichenicoccus roseus TaxID=2683649 RepID=A0A5R9J9W0_9PROT|nr:response regulator transcription factor [Lichenicoccus roseus]